MLSSPKPSGKRPRANPPAVAAGSRGTKPAAVTREAELTESPASPLAVAALLLVSGCCALVFQVVWTRELRLTFGATTASSAAVLAIFMGGLGLGSAVLGRRLDATMLPLRAYAWLEAGIAASAALSPLLIDLVEVAYIAIGGQGQLGPLGATLVRLAASAAVLLVPTFLMGGTMPAAARAVAVAADPHRRGIALVYGVNTLGAVIGAGLANFLLLEHLGGRWTLWLACGVNFALAAAAFRLARRLRRHATAARQAPPAPVKHAPPSAAASHPALVYFAAGVVGCAFFLMEIVWYRMLGTLLGGTTYTFGLILCIALLGIGAGGVAYHLATRWLRPSLALFALTCALEAASIAIPFWCGDAIALWVLAQQNEPVHSLAAQIWNWWQVGAAVILPAALVAGFQFPLLIAIAGSGCRNVGRQVGWTCAANTLGAMLGSLAGGFLLLPLLTAPGAWQLVVGLLLALAAVAAVAGRTGDKWTLGLAATGGIVALLAIGSRGPTAVWRHSGIGAGRAEVASQSKNDLQEFMHKRRRQCIWSAEGVETSVAITATDSLSFIVNGKADGNAFGDAGTQIGLGLVGPLLHRGPRTGLMIGLGTGESAGWLAAARSMQTVDVVELEPAVVEMARRCRGVNRDVLANPKVQLHFNDAREHLLTTKARYDLIVSEPSNPYRAGIANLYTRDFYRAAHQRLAPDGLFLQWLQGYEVDLRTVQIVLHTLRSVFPAVEVWRTKSRDLLVVCGQSPAALAYDAQSLQANLSEPALREGLRHAWRVDDLAGALAHYVCGARTIDELLAGAEHPWNTDDRNALEYAFAKTLGQQTRFSTDQLQSLALKLDDDSPLEDDSVDRQLVRRRRLALAFWFGKAVPVDQIAVEHRPQAQGLALYRAQRYDEAAQAWRNVDAASLCPIESSALAHSLAETAGSIPSAALASVATTSPAEAEAILAILHFRQGNSPSAFEHMVLALSQLQTDPWANPQVIDSLLGIAGDLPAGERVKIERIFRQIKLPWATYRLDDSRLMLRCVLAEHLGDGAVIEALSPLEPHVPWKAWLLETRAKAYAAHDHPRAAAAQRDLAQFQRWALARE